MPSRFLRYLGLLILVVFVADRLVFFCLSSIQKNTYTGIQGGKINDYLSHPAPALVVMGPSAPANQIDPAAFVANTYNLGHPDTEDAFQAALLSVIIENKRAPRNILLHVDPAAYKGDDSAGTYVSKSPLKLGFYFNENPVVTKYIKEIGIRERIKYFMMLTRYNNRVFGMLKDYATTRIHGPFHNGFFPFRASSRDSINVLADYGRLTQKHLPGGKAIQVSKMRYLLSFINTCKENNINLLLFTLPTYKDVAMPPALNFETVSLVKFCAAHNVQYFDFRNSRLPAMIRRPSYWKDVQHLNELGSPVESAFIAKEISPFLRP